MYYNSFSEALEESFETVTHSHMLLLLERHGILPTDLAHPEMPNTSFYDEYGFSVDYNTSDICAYLGY